MSKVSANNDKIMSEYKMIKSQIDQLPREYQLIFAQKSDQTAVEQPMSKEMEELMEQLKEAQ